MGRRLVVLGSLVAALAVAGAAEASWSMGGGGSGFSRASAMPAGLAPTHSISTYPNVALGWTPLSVGGAPVSYVVRRYAEGGTLQPIGSGCSGTVAASSCTESSVPVGRWQYTVQTTKGSWLGAESPRSTTVEIAAPPTSLACTNCHTYGGTIYINAANSAAVHLQAVLPSTSLATDTANATLTDSAGHSASTTAPALSGAGTVAFPNVSTAALADGALTAAAYVTANTGDVSSSTSLALVRDTVAPAGSNAVAANGGTARRIDDGDTVTFTFSEPVDPGTIKSGWNGTSTTVTVTFTNSGGNDTFVVGGTNLGSVNTTANYVSGTATCAGSTMSASGSTVTVTLGACGGSTRNGPGGGTQFLWTPSSAMTDLAGNPVSTATVTGANGGF